LFLTCISSSATMIFSLKLLLALLPSSSARPPLSLLESFELLLWRSQNLLFAVYFLSLNLKRTEFLLFGSLSVWLLLPPPFNAFNAFKEVLALCERSSGWSGGGPAPAANNWAPPTFMLVFAAPVVVVEAPMLFLAYLYCTFAEPSVPKVCCWEFFDAWCEIWACLDVPADFLDNFMEDFSGLAVWYCLSAADWFVSGTIKGNFCSEFSAATAKGL